MSISIYEKKSEYVARLEEILRVSDRFESLAYARDYIGGDEYLRIRNTCGDTFYINVTGNSEGAILLEVARFVNGIRPTGYVSNREKRWKVSELFRKAV
ncbi:MAG: hypothetical protein IJV70_00750 [Clostridia bacterium]|nr:hypothetical protein [Clostridia bacterium]